MKVIVMRLTPGTEVVTVLHDAVRERIPGGGCILSCVGSVTEATLRYATGSDGKSHEVQTLKGHFEVLSLQGTLTIDGCHLHICLSDAAGKTVGGHVMGRGLVTQTTMELVIGQFENLSLSREMDSNTGFKELVVTEDKT